MSHTLERGVAALLLVSAAACAPAVTVNTTSEEAAIRAVGADWRNAVQARNLDRIVALHTPDAVMLVSNAPAASGSAAIRTSWSDLFNMQNLSLTWNPTRIDVASSGDFAVEQGTYQLSFDSPAGRVTDSGGYSTWWRKVNGEWRVARDAVVSTTPLPQPASATANGGTAIAEVADMETRSSAAITWTDLDVPGFAPGLQMAVIHGDPSKSGDYALRLRFPAGYEFPVHWHPQGEHLTVLSGIFRLGMGNAANPTAVRDYSPGDFIYIPPRMAHFGGATGVTVVQLHGIGPFAINLGAP